MRYALLVLVFLFSCSAAHGQAGQATEIKAGPTNPTTCNASRGWLFWNTSSNTMENCSTTNTWSPLGASSTISSLTGVVSCLDVSPACVPDASSLDASTTNSSNIVTCPNSDCHFLTTAAIGNVFQCGASTVTAGSAGVIINTTTIQSVDSDTQVHTVANATASTTATAYCAWGVDNTASMDALSNATVKVCKYGFIPAGVYLTSHGGFNKFNAGCANANAGRVGGLIGAGTTWLDTKLLIMYTINYATQCPATTGSGASGANVCFFGVLALDVRAIAIDGMLNNTNPAAGTYMAENNAGYWDRVGISGAAGALAPANLSMSHYFGTEGITRESAMVGGTNACVNEGTGTQFIINPCLQGGAYGLLAFSGSIHSMGSYYGGGTAAAYCFSGATCYHNNDNAQSGTWLNAGTGYYDRVVGASITGNSPGVHTIRDSVVTATTNNSGATLIDGGSNTFGAVTNSGTWVGDASITGTALATGNVAITSCGTSTAGTFSGFSRKGQFTITFAGTPGTSCVATVTFPNAFLGTTPVCTWYVQGGTNTPATTIALGTQSKTSTAVTFSGPTFTNANTMIVQYECLSP